MITCCRCLRPRPRTDVIAQTIVRPRVDVVWTCADLLGCLHVRGLR